MTDRETVSKNGRAEKAPAQNLAYGLFGRRVATVAGRPEEMGKLTGQAA